MKLEKLTFVMSSFIYFYREEKVHFYSHHYKTEFFFGCQEASWNPWLSIISIGPDLIFVDNEQVLNFSSVIIWINQSV